MICSAMKSQGGRRDLLLRARMTSSASTSGKPCACPSEFKWAGTAQRASGAIARPASTMLSSPIKLGLSYEVR